MAPNPCKGEQNILLYCTGAPLGTQKKSGYSSIKQTNGKVFVRFMMQYSSTVKIAVVYGTLCVQFGSILQQYCPWEYRVHHLRIISIMKSGVLSSMTDKIIEEPQKSILLD